MSYFVAMFALMSTHGTSKTFNMGCITTLATSVCLLIGVFLFELFIFLRQSVSFLSSCWYLEVGWLWLEFSLFS